MVAFPLLAAGTALGQPSRLRFYRSGMLGRIVQVPELEDSPTDTNGKLGNFPGTRVMLFLYGDCNLDSAHWFSRQNNDFLSPFNNLSSLQWLLLALRKGGPIHGVHDALKIYVQTLDRICQYESARSFGTF